MTWWRRRLWCRLEAQASAVPMPLPVPAPVQGVVQPLPIRTSSSSPHLTLSPTFADSGVVAAPGPLLGAPGAASGRGEAESVELMASPIAMPVPLPAPTPEAGCEEISPMPDVDPAFAAGVAPDWSLPVWAPVSDGGVGVSSGGLPDGGHAGGASVTGPAGMHASWLWHRLQC